MRDYPTLHSFTNYSKGTALLVLFYISITVGSSIMSVTHTLKWVWNSPSLVLFTSVNKHYIWAFPIIQVLFVIEIYFQDVGLSMKYK